MTPLICQRCGAPLPRPSGDSPYSTCSFCGTTSSLHGGAAVVPAGEVPWSERKQRIQRELDAFEREYRARVDRKEPPYEAFRAAAAAALSGICDADAISNVAFGLAAELELTSDARIERDPIALMRLASGYLDASERLREQGEVTLNLPFITATAAGPVHFQKRLTIPILVELAGRRASAVRQGWWKRLFG